jgi:hypothetical protein
MKRAILFILALSACSYRPARFGSGSLAFRAEDDAASPVPQHRALIQELYDADVYVRRELVKALDPRRPGEAQDINAIDEVPMSSWFRPPIFFGAPLGPYPHDGPPEPPFTYLEKPPVSGTPGAHAIIDARGLAYELVPDIRGRAGMRTSAAAIASRLAFAVGYRTPEVHVLITPEGERYAATRWPIGADLGPTPIDTRRDDDPNDHVDHRDRRTLRALQLVTAWLDMKRMPPRILRDAYVGEPGKGHVEHFLVGFDGALGVDDWREAVRWMRDPDREDANFFLRLFSFGLSPKPAAFPPDTPWPSIGLLDETVAMDAYSPSPPFEPIDRLQAGDAYWMAKRLASLSHETVAEAVSASRLTLPEQHWLFQVLSRRRAQIVAWGYDRVTPLEFGLFVPEDAEKKLPPRLVLIDWAIRHRMMTPERSSYRVRFLDARGEEVAQAETVRAAQDRVVATLPPSLKQLEYVVVQVQGARDGHDLPRFVEVHLRPSKAGYTLAGVRH